MKERECPFDVDHDQAGDKRYRHHHKRSVPHKNHKVRTKSRVLYEFTIRVNILDNSYVLQQGLELSRPVDQWVRLWIVEGGEGWPGSGLGRRRASSSSERRRKAYGGLRMDPAKGFKSLEQENARLKKRVAALSLDNQILKEVSSGNF